MSRDPRRTGDRTNLRERPMTRAAHCRQFLAVFVVAILATPLLAQSPSEPVGNSPATSAPSKSAPVTKVTIKTIVSGLPSADDSPLVRSAKIAMLERARYAAEGRESIAIDVRMIPSFGSLGSVPPLGPLGPARASGPGSGPTNLVSNARAAAAVAPSPPSAVRVVPGYSTVREVATTSVTGSVPMSSVGGSVSMSSAAGSVGMTSAASSVPISSPASSASVSPVVP